ncbi:MAG TPA: hypothetical protein VN224_05055 [Xanthomonadales bacterium]|nr:hypothetical protein [Xanthomonadales bacterium]
MAGTLSPSGEPDAEAMTGGTERLPPPAAQPAAKNSVKSPMAWRRTQ